MKQQLMEEVLALERTVRLGEAVAVATYGQLRGREGVSYHHRNALDKSFRDADKCWEDTCDARSKLSEIDDQQQLRLPNATAVDETAIAIGSSVRSAGVPFLASTGESRRSCCDGDEPPAGEARPRTEAKVGPSFPLHREAKESG